MRVALVGYGRMGKELERLASEMGHSIVAVFDENRLFSESSSVERAEVLIDFSVGGAVLGVLRAAALRGIPVIEGTTGWYDQLDQAVGIENLTILYSPNFSVGVYQFNRLVRVAAELFGSLGHYDTYVHEWHHAGKVDSPSGTAKHLAELLVNALPQKREPLYETCHRKIDSNQLHVTSTRVGRVPGIHEVGFDSEFDSIQLKHVSHGRTAYAYGALRAAEWIVGRKGVFTMDDWMASVGAAAGDL